MNDKEIFNGLSITLEDMHVADLISPERGVAVVPIRGGIDRLLKRLIDLSKNLTYFDALAHTPTHVVQNFKSCGEFEESENIFWKELAARIQIGLQRGFDDSGRERLLSCPLSFTDLAVQDYSQSKIDENFGISPHRDQSGFVNLVVVLLISGPSSFHICQDKEGNGATEIRAQPGDLILMRGGEFGKGRGLVLPRPYHFVGRIENPEGRLSFGLRQITTDSVKASRLREIFSA